MNAKNITCNAAKMAVLTFILFYANISMATVYECDATQTTYWKDWKNGLLMQHPYAVILFDDETAVLLLGDALTETYTGDGSHTGGLLERRPLKIVAKENGLHKWLVAAYDIADYHDIGISDIHTDTVFHLYIGDKDNGMYFSLDDQGTTSTGQCHIDKKQRPDRSIECGWPLSIHRPGPGIVCP